LNEIYGTLAPLGTICVKFKGQDHMSKLKVTLGK